MKQIYHRCNKRSGLSTMIQTLTQVRYPREGVMSLYRGLVKEGNRTRYHHLRDIPSCSERERLQVLETLSLLPPCTGQINKCRAESPAHTNEKVSPRHLGLYARTRKKKYTTRFEKLFALVSMFRAKSWTVEKSLDDG